LCIQRTLFQKCKITFHRTTSINKLSKVGSITANFNGTIRFCDSTPNKKCPSIPPSFINTFTVLPSRDRLIDGCFSSSVFSKQEAASSFSNSRIKPWSLWRSFISESGQTLFLPSGKLYAPFTYHGVIAFGKLHYKIMSPCDFAALTISSKEASLLP